MKYTMELMTPNKTWLERFVERMREADQRELTAANGDVWTAVRESIAHSESVYRVTGENGEPLVLYGKCQIDNLPGRLIWCVATNDLKPYQREFARVSRDILQRWAAAYGILWNAVGVFNKPARRWLQWCGAEFGDSLVMGGEQFIRFYIRRRDNV